MTVTEALPAASEVAATDTEEVPAEPEVTPWDAINPCPVCQRLQATAPEREARTALHCYACGFTRGQGVAAHLVSPTPVDVKKLVAELRQGVLEDLAELIRSGGGQLVLNVNGNPEVPGTTVPANTVEATAVPTPTVPPGYGAVS